MTPKAIVSRVMFTLERSTKNTHRYQEVVGEGEAEAEVIGTLYVQKSALDKKGDGVVETPATIYVTIEV